MDRPAVPPAVRLNSLLALARRLLGDGHPAEARQILSQHLRREPNDVRGWILASYASRISGDPQGAILAARRAASVETHDGGLAALQALCLVRAGLHGDALKLVDRLHRDPTAHGLDVAAFLQLSQVEDLLGRPEAALDAVRRAASLGPTDLGTAMQLALRLERAGQPAEARALVAWLVERHPEHPQLVTALRRLGGPFEKTSRSA